MKRKLNSAGNEVQEHEEKRLWGTERFESKWPQNVCKCAPRALSEKCARASLQYYRPRTSEPLRVAFSDLFSSSFGKEDGEGVLDAHPRVLVFHGPAGEGDTHVKYLEDLGSRYPLNTIIGVTNKLDDLSGNYDYGISQIEDSQGLLAREFRVLHPLGGGRISMDCIVFLGHCESGRYEFRGFVPLCSGIGRVHAPSDLESLKGMVDDSLQALFYEMAQYRVNTR
jgi:hypothetical protein